MSVDRERFVLTESAFVIAVESDGLWVETFKQSSCSSCSAKQGCGQHVLAKYMTNMTCIKAVFKDGLSTKIWKIGDKVQIGVDEKAFVVSALSAYIFPLVCLLAASAFAYKLGAADLLVAFSGLAGLVVGGCLVKRGFIAKSKPGKTRSLNSLSVIVMDTKESEETY